MSIRLRTRILWYMLAAVLVYFLSVSTIFMRNGGDIAMLPWLKVSSVLLFLVNLIALPVIGKDLETRVRGCRSIPERTSTVMEEVTNLGISGQILTIVFLFGYIVLLGSFNVSEDMIFGSIAGTIVVQIGSAFYAYYLLCRLRSPNKIRYNQVRPQSEAPRIRRT